MRLAHLVVLQVHHVKDIALSQLGRDLATLVVRADDVQVVIDVYLNSVVITYEAGEKEIKRQLITILMLVLD